MGRRRTYEFNESLVAISSNVALSVHNFSEWFAKIDKFFLAALPWQVAKVKNLGRRLRVAKLRLSCRGGHD